MIIIDLNIVKTGYLAPSPKSSLNKKERGIRSPVYLLFLVLYPPEEVPSSEDWLTQCLGRIISHEMHISPYLQEIFLCHSLLCEMPILGKVLSKVAAIQYLCQQQLSSSLIHWNYHLLLRQSQCLMQYIHHRTCKIPQSKMLQFSLQSITNNLSLFTT